MENSNPIYFGQCTPSAAAASELLKIVSEAVLKCQPGYASDCRKLMQAMKNCSQTEEDALYDERYPVIFADYCHAIIQTVKANILNNTYALSRIDDALSHPKLYSFSDLCFEKGELAGFVFAAFWYAITADPDGCKNISNIMVELNSFQDSLMDGTLEQLRKECYGSPQPQHSTYSPRKKVSSWPYWIAMLVIGIIIGIISRSCS